MKKALVIDKVLVVFNLFGSLNYLLFGMGFAVIVL
jgi:hypothetical protein